MLSREGARLVSGAVSRASVVGATGSIVGGALVGILGAVIGTFGFHAVRMKLAAVFGRDTRAAFIKDAIAIGGAFLIVVALR